MAEDAQDGAVISAGTSKRRKSSTDQSAARPAPRRVSASDPKGKGRAVNLDNDDDAIHKDSPESCYASDEDESMHCAICLSVIDDRTVLQPCNHDAFCFVCILAWTDQSRKCPLCIAAIDLLIHNIRSEKDFQRHYLPPLAEKTENGESSIRELYEGARRQLRDRPTHPRFKYSDWQARNRPVEMPDMDQEDLALQKRKYIYRHGLYVKHVASNRYTRYRDHTAQQFSNSPELKQRLTRWLRRELQVFDGVDMEFLVGYCVSIASQLELRSDPAVRLLSEFLGDRDAEHFLHEAHSFMRSPFKDIRNYDRAVQYDRPERKMGSYKPSYETQKASTATSGQRRADPMLLPAAPKPRRSRSRSFSSDSDAGPYRRTSFTKARRLSEIEQRAQPAQRTGRDVYIPEYSRQRHRRPSDAHRRRFPSPRREQRHHHFDSPMSTPDIRPDGQQSALLNKSETPVIPQHEVSQESIAAVVQELQDLSDLEDIISLGESEGESASLVTPYDSIVQSVAVRDADEDSKSNLRAEGSAQGRDVSSKPAISIRGVARQPKAASLLSRAKPDLLSRISGIAMANGPRHQDRLAYDRSTRPEDKSASHKYSGTVSQDLKTALMARLKTEKDIHQAVESRLAVVRTAEREEKLRQNVLAVVAAKKEKAAQLSDHMAMLRERLQRERDGPWYEDECDADFADEEAEDELPLPVLDDRQALLRAKIQKERQLAVLRAKLAGEKQNLQSKA